MVALKSQKRPETLKETTLQELRRAITFGQFKPGDRLVERVLCEKLDVSRTVVRECIRHLESERLITVRPNNGPVVASLSLNDVKEIYWLRQQMEEEAVAKCALNSTAQDIAFLKSRCKSIAKAMNKKDIQTVLNHTHDFYERIFIVGDMNVSWDIENQLNRRIAILRRMTLQTSGRDVTGPKNLERITQAIENKDPKSAKKAVATHVKEALSLALKELKK